MISRERTSERTGKCADYDVYIGSHRKESDARLNYDTLERATSANALSKIAMCTELAVKENIQLRIQLLLHCTPDTDLIVCERVINVPMINFRVIGRRKDDLT